MVIFPRNREDAAKHYERCRDNYDEPGGRKMTRSRALKKTYNGRRGRANTPIQEPLPIPFMHCLPEQQLKIVTKFYREEPD